MPRRVPPRQPLIDALPSAALDHAVRTGKGGWWIWRRWRSSRCCSAWALPCVAR